VSQKIVAVHELLDALEGIKISGPNALKKAEEIGAEIDHWLEIMEDSKRKAEELWWWGTFNNVPCSKILGINDYNDLDIDCIEKY